MMKKRITLLSAAGIVTALAFLTVNAESSAKKPTVSSNTTVYQNGTKALSVRGNGYKITKVSVNSDRKDVAQAAAGKTAVTVYGIKPGTAKLTVTVKAKKGKKTESFQRKTVVKVKAPSAALSQTSVEAGQSAKVVMHNVAKGAKITYLSIDRDVAAVSEAGVVSALARGDSRITACVALPKTKYAPAKSIILTAGDFGVTAREADAFYISEITDELFARIKGKSFKDDCTLPREDLRYVHVLHKDIDGNTLEGEMIVNVHIADDILDILHELFQNDYPIERMVLVDEYNAVDEASMRDNNSSSFNFRFISHTTRVSKHGLGLAVDINTLYNPYTKMVDSGRLIEPLTGEPYLDRDADFDYKIEKGDLCYKLFTEHGFEWGGDWTDRKDYQHFEIPTDRIAEWYPDNQ